MLSRQFLTRAAKVAKTNASNERQSAHDREYRSMRLASRDDFMYRVKAGRVGYDLDTKDPKPWQYDVTTKTWS